MVRIAYAREPLLGAHLGDGDTSPSKTKRLIGSLRSSREAFDGARFTRFARLAIVAAFLVSLLLMLVLAPHQKLKQALAPQPQASSNLTMISLQGVDPLAVCSDGTPAAYYWRPGTTDASMWIVDLQSGDWCFDLESCRSRCPEGSTNPLCGSAGYPSTKNLDGLFNPRYGDAMLGANMVYVEYCTSDAHMADTEAFGYHFRGARVLRAVFRDLVARHGLAGGQQKDVVVLAGQSAGSRGAMVHLDYVHEMVAAAGGRKVDVFGFLDSPLWMDVPMFNDVPLGNLTQQVQAVFGFADRSYLGPHCAKAHPGNDGWKCLMGQYRMPYVRTPYFLIASQNDKFQLAKRIGHPPSSPKELEYAEDLALRTRTFVKQLRQSWPESAVRQNAVLSWRCFDHATTLQHDGFRKQSCQGATVADAFSEYMGRLRHSSGWLATFQRSWRSMLGDELPPSWEWVDTCEGFACGPGCDPQFHPPSPSPRCGSMFRSSSTGSKDCR